MFRKTSLNLNNVWLHCSPKQLIYCKLLSTYEIARIHFGKFKKLLWKSYCFGSLFLMYSYFLYFLMEFLSLKTNYTDCHFLKAYILKAQLTITCSKSTIKALEQGVNYIQNKQQKHRRGDVSVVVQMSLYLTLNMFVRMFLLHVWLSCTHFSIANFEQIFVYWEVFEFLEIPYIEITVTYKHGGFIG